MKFWPALIGTAVLSAGLGFFAGRFSVHMAPHATRARVAAAAPAPSGIDVAPIAGAPKPAAGPAAPASGVPALNLLRTVIDTHGAQAQACLVFSAALTTGADIHPADFIRIEPAIRPALQANGDRFCVAGLSFGTSYKLTVLAGLRGAGGARTLSDEVLPLSLGDLPTSTDFADDGFILPRDAAGGLPIATVNVASVHLRVDRITDRVLVRTGLGQRFTDNEGDYDPDTESSSDTLGVRLWEGDLSVHGARNDRVVTAFPLSQLLRPRLPGAYRITLVKKTRGYRGQMEEQNDYRWVFDTDLMLTTHRGADGLHVFVRSLKSAKPLPGAQVSLLAANNDELGHAAANANGEAVFPAGLLRGMNGHLPRMVMAYLADDFTALQLNKPGFDFSDRGVDGRPDPGPVDGFLYTDRGIYRPGETIDLTTLVRGRLAEPLPAGQAVSVSLRRPDGVEAGKWRLVPNEVGAATQLIVLKPTAPRGTWRLEEALAGTTPLIGALDVQVQDFVPNRLAVDLTPKAPRITPDEAAEIDVASRFLYGAPAPDLEVSAHVQLQRDTSPVPEKSWQFGNETEKLNIEAQDFAGVRTDAQGRSSVRIDEAGLHVPQTTLPLRADITVSVAEPGGRATESRISLPVTTRNVLLGVRPPNPEGQIDEGSAASVAVGAFAPDGMRLARRVAFRLVEQVTQFHYFERDGSWQWKTSTFDRPVTFGSVDVPAAEGGATITLPRLDWGTYRLEVNDEPSGAFTAIILHAGFSPAPEAAESPEKVSVTLAGPAPLPGGTARLHIKPPFAGEMLLTVENSRVLAVQTAAIPAAGADVTVRASADWGVGAYVMASVYRPSGSAAGHAPVRAVGLAYVKLDVSPRTIGVALTAPAVLRPRTHLDLPIHVTGQAAAGGKVYLTLAAVDEGILQLTRFATPDPDGHFFGKRRLAVDVRDDYGHLIDGNGAAPGNIRSGGDLDGAGLSVVPTRTTALFSGLVQANPDGSAIIPLDLPDFTGGLRLMAVAVSQAGFGHADAQVPVRDPVVAQISLPRFLAPGDAARMTLLAHNVEAPAGTFHVHLAATGALAMQAVDEDVTLGAHQALVKTYGLGAGDVGIGKVTLTLTGPGGLHIVHDWDMQVRTPFQSDTRVARADQPAGATVKLTQDLASGFTPAGATVLASFSSVGNIDVPGLLAALDEYPFGCSEQLVSRAMPLLFVEQEAAATLGVAPGDLRLRVQDAIDKLLERQDEAGAFGLWRAGDGQAEPYLGGLIIDFLMRARAHDYAVPQAAIDLGRKALADMQGDQWMLHRFWFRTPGPAEDERIIDAGRAYGLLLAARAGKADPGDARYLNDTSLHRLEPLSQGQLAVALSIEGDTARAAAAFDSAERGLANENDDLNWRLADYYRTRLRDTAALVSLAAEAGDRARVDRLLRDLDRLDMRTERLSTQEQGWLVIAAGTLLEKAGPVSVTVDGNAQPLRAVLTIRRDVTALGAGVAVKNVGAGPVSRVISVRGLPLRAPAAAASLIHIDKQITDSDGNKVDFAHLRQNSRLVVHLSGHADDTAYHQTMLVDPLPAGFEIERVVAPSTKDAANGLPWLGDITPTRMAEKRDDRFMAAIDLGRSSYVGEDETRHVSSGDFNVAYVVRVVSPGQFVLPAASIRDMYRPDVQARGSVGRVTVEVPH
jgi:uncharacterized protein YfaS (alpha-2-macroglobulin family)